MRRARVHAALARGLGILLATSAAWPDAAAEPEVPSGVLVVEVTEIPSPGTLFFELYDARFQKRWGTPLRRERVEVGERSAAWRIEALAQGDYAVRVFLDQNGNEALDRTRNGVPREPFGFSNNVLRRLGPPRLEAAAFAFAAAEQKISIQLRSRATQAKRPDASSPPAAPDEGD
jgi:uncharacterized protein (DUF2141 family)